jgi:hypothetical protein
MDAETAERLLGGEVVSGHERLAALLASAGAPARPQETGNVAAAVLAFRAARCDLDAAPVDPPARRGIATALIIKILAVVAAVGGVGGVAVAASTGRLPEPERERAQPAASSHRSEAPAPGAPMMAPGASAGVSLRDLCDDYVGGDRNQRGQTLDHDPRFKPLTDRAGGADPDRVDQLCEEVREHPEGWQGDASPAQPGMPQVTGPSNPGQPWDGPYPGFPSMEGMPTGWPTPLSPFGLPPPWPSAGAPESPPHAQDGERPADEHDGERQPLAVTPR